MSTSWNYQQAQADKLMEGMSLKQIFDVFECVLESRYPDKKVSTTDINECAGQEAVAVCILALIQTRPKPGEKMV